MEIDGPRPASDAGDEWQEPGPGSSCVNRVPVLELTDGTPVALSAVVIDGASDGPALYVGGGVHGDEVGAVAIVQRVIREIDPAQLSGRVVCVPVQNPLAFQMHHRLSLQLVQVSPMDQFPGDPWLQFPGAVDGNGTQAIAARLWELMTAADVVVDVHTPTTGGRYVPFIFVPPARVGEGAARSLELAKAFRPDFILNATEGVYVQDGTPHVELARRGIPAFGFEIGEGGRVDEDCVARGWEGVRNLMRHLGMLPGDHRADPAPRIVSSMTAVRTQRGGLWSCTLPLGIEVGAGDAIGAVTTPWGEQVDELVSPHAGPLMRLTTFASVAGSDRIAQIGVEQD
jgi:predicted deacylase